MSSEKDVAIEEVRRRQAGRLRAYGVRPIPREPQVQAALAQAKDREASAVFDGDWIHAGQFRYSAKLEKLRWQYTRDVIERVVPGPYEDASYIEMLARHAASIEMMLRNEYGESGDQVARKPLTPQLRPVLLATTPEPALAASSSPVGANYIMVSVSAGLMELVYQTAKAVALSLAPVPAPEGHSAAYSTDLRDTEALLAKNSYPVDLLLGTWQSYFFDGWPRWKHSKMPPIEYHAILALLDEMAERFVVAHEYSHAFLHFSKEFPQFSNLSSWEKEFQADYFAYFLTLGSATNLDRFAPNMALQGPLFALYNLKLLCEARDAIIEGKIRDDFSTDTHPDPRMRIELLKTAYSQDFPTSSDTEALALAAAIIPIQILDILWKRVLPKLLALRGTAELHPMWKQ